MACQAVVYVPGSVGAVKVNTYGRLGSGTGGVQGLLSGCAHLQPADEFQAVARIPVAGAVVLHQPALVHACAGGDDCAIRDGDIFYEGQPVRAGRRGCRAGDWLKYWRGCGYEGRGPKHQGQCRCGGFGGNKWRGGGCGGTSRGQEKFQ